MLGIEHRILKRRTLRGLAPPNLFFPKPRINASPRAAAFALLQNGASARNGLSLAHNGFHFHELHCRVNAPGLLLRVLASRFRNPFGLPAPLPALVCPRTDRFNAGKPVAASATGSLDCSNSLHSPSGFLHPSGSKRSAVLAAQRPAFRLRPISVRSPPPIAI